MHKKFTFNGSAVFRIAVFTFLGLILGIAGSNAQTPWSGVYGNEWLAGKYGQEWVKIGVNQKGIQKVTLTGNFIGKQGQLHLYHRGVEVALTSATSNAIEFYGVPNDGASDALLYRDQSHNPDPNQRTNDKYSIYSDVSAYFLTYTTSANGERANVLNDAVTNISEEKYHIQTELKVFADQYSYSVDINFITLSLVQSYLENGKGMTSGIYGKHATVTNPSLLGDPTIQLPVKNLYSNSEVQAQLEVLLYGRTTSSNNVTVQVGKDASSLRSVGTEMAFAGFTGFKQQFTLNVSDQEASSDLPSNGNFSVKLSSNKVTADYSTTGLYSVTYLQMKYPQIIDMSGQSSYLLGLPAKTTDVNMSKVIIANAPANAKIYDISNPDKPKILTGYYQASSLNVMVSREINQPVTLLVTVANPIDVSSKVNGVEIVDYDPASFNYLIVTTENLKPAADEYKVFRGSRVGGSLNPLVTNINDIYNRFNYGEPSPVAIRRYVDYMISKGIRANHYLLLIGNSVSEGDQTPTNKELVSQVPTIGFPGSDVLLVEGLKGTASEVPAIPTGRITATTVEQVRNYLEKVESYEQSNESLSYRKKAIHMNGGVNIGETDRFGGYYTGTLNSKVTSAPFLGSVITKQKPADKLNSPEDLDITQDVNSGVGFMSYFGHGNPHYTDYDMGYISDERKLYNNTGKYPVMYFNGCGVGNIFKGSILPYPDNYTGSDKNLAKEVMPMTADWMLAKQAGAIAIIGNSFYAFESSSRDYLFALYDQVFPKSDNERMTIGKIHQSTARFIITGTANGRVAAVDDYTMANTHQSLLQGDPALRILSTSPIPFPVELFGFKGKPNGNSVMLEWNTAWERNNGRFVVERSYNAKNFVEIGSVEGKGNSNQQSYYNFFDTNPIKGINYYRLKQVDLISSGSTNENFNYSSIISVVTSQDDVFLVYPNPSSDAVNVGLNIPATLTSWSLTDVSGQIISKGITLKPISIKGFKNGEYILKIVTSNGDVYSKKIVKQ
ncbi:C25 family cysteine peptidase [Dyadobacter sp. 3J3]|uniref:putative type IX secretion system sortase PorU2 n=1 Tax=Dyadobacter sp. 3J3 TaxID=2606600 RepID=UPI001357D54B|nr:C25 family cysteine peptidase [Dyadobacter sp. 3J3]